VAVVAQVLQLLVAQAVVAVRVALVEARHKDLLVALLLARHRVQEVEALGLLVLLL
jgi:hypothetical protein